VGTGDTGRLAPYRLHSSTSPIEKQTGSYRCRLKFCQAVGPKFNHLGWTMPPVDTGIEGAEIFQKSR
jgi:hypothetical protein